MQKEGSSPTAGVDCRSGGTHTRPGRFKISSFTENCIKGSLPITIPQFHKGGVLLFFLTEIIKKKRTNLSVILKFD